LSERTPDSLSRVLQPIQGPKEQIANLRHRGRKWIS
jgi:hypothetical protein